MHQELYTLVLLGGRRASAKRQVAEGDRATAGNEAASCAKHTKAGLDFAEAVSQVVLPVQQILNVCICLGSQSLCAAGV